MELGSPERGPRQPRTLDDPLGVELVPEVRIVRVAIDADDGDEDDVRGARTCRLLQQAPGSFHIHLARLAEGARCAVDYRADALEGFLKAPSGE